jgi:aryl-alcohol dehydrogenase-like predicted oxidoreductase
MKGRREDFFVATKIGWMGFEEGAQMSAYDSTEKLIKGVETNLKRLDTDYVDLIQCHINFQEPNMKYFLEWFQKLQAVGKVLSYGVSSSNFEFIKSFNADGGTTALQIDYSILNRIPEKEIFPYCLEHDIGVIVRGPLAMGILTGKFKADIQFPEGDFRRNWHVNPEEYQIFLDDLGKVEQLRKLPREGTLAQLALQFVLAHPAVTTVIPGAKTVDQLEQNVAAGLMPPLDKDLLTQINAIVPPGGGRKIWPA